MPKKLTTRRFVKLKTVTRSVDKTWHNGRDIEINFYADSLRKAAAVLLVQLDDDPKHVWDVGPIILLYRQAVELRLKLLVGEGSQFLPSPTDSITLWKTHSSRWLAQIVCQIIRTVRWEDEFRCEGIRCLEDFSALIAELDALDPVSAAMMTDKQSLPGLLPQALHRSKVVALAPRLDALLDLLDATGDGLAATWDLRQSGMTEEDLLFEDVSKPTIH